MKHQWIKGLSVMLLAVVMAIAAGILACAGAEDLSSREYTDEKGNRFRVVPLGDGRYELWQLVDVQQGSGGSTEVNPEECKHEYRKWDKGNDQFHWEECLDCGKLMPPELHVYDQVTITKAATCKQDAVVTRSCVCGRVDPDNTAPVEGDPVECFAHHTWGSEYSGDYLGHWQTCVICGERSDIASHTLSNIKTEREPTCLKNGVVSFDCAVCRQHYDYVDASGLMLERHPQLQQYTALGHDFSGPLKVSTGPNKCTAREKGTHAVTCTRCGTTDSANRTDHSWSEYTISNGTCEDPNDPVIIGGTCECGATLELSYERHHKYVKDSSQDVQPTCTEPGKVNGERCIYCGIFGNYDFVEPHGHEWYDDETKARIEPTCTTEGTIFTFCLYCDATSTRPIKTISPKGEHEFVKYAPLGDSSVCLGQGSYLMKCKYCDTYQNEDRIQVEKLAHDTYEVTRNDGNEMHGTTKDGLPMVGQSYETKVYCRRCNRHLGTSYRTVWKSMRGTRFQIFPERRYVADDLDRNKGATVVTGQMGRNNNGYFENIVRDALSKDIKDSLKDYDYTE